MTILENYDWGSRTKAGRTPKYPWDEWFDGQTRVIMKGEDYTCKTESMQTILRMKIRDRADLEVRTRTTDDGSGGQAIIFQYTKVEVTDG